MSKGKLSHILEDNAMFKPRVVPTNAEGFPIFRTTYNFDPVAWSNAYGLACTDPSLTVQSQAAEADINTIVRNFGVTGKLPESLVLPSYGDFDGVEDFRSALDAVRAAEAEFMKLPSDLRGRLDNDPQKFLEYCADSSNLEEMRKLGLAVPAPVPSASDGS